MAMSLAVHIRAFKHIAIGKPENPMAVRLAVHICAFPHIAIGRPLDLTAVFFAVQISIDGVDFNGLGAATTGQ